MPAPQPGAGASGSHITPPPELVELVMAALEVLAFVEVGPVAVVASASVVAPALGAPPVTVVEPTPGPGPLVAAPPAPDPSMLG
jgi:hypothetical protein